MRVNRLWPILGRVAHLFRGGGCDYCVEPCPHSYGHRTPTGSSVGSSRPCPLPDGRGSDWAQKQTAGVTLADRLLRRRSGHTRQPSMAHPWPTGRLS